MALVSASKRWSGSTAKACGKPAGTCNQYLTKGQQVYVEGRLTTRTCQTKDGQTSFSLDVTVNDMQFLGVSEMSQQRMTVKKMK
jgi:single-stranded DNA-binding protein